MINDKTVAVVGGDLRQAHLANTLIEKNAGFTVHGMFLENGVKLTSKIHKSNDIKLVLPQSGVVIFPLPLLGAGGFVNTPQSAQTIALEECLEYISPTASVFAGMVPPQAKEMAARQGIEITDYYLREEFAVMNAVPAALYKMRLKQPF